MTEINRDTFRVLLMYNVGKLVCLLPALEAITSHTWMWGAQAEANLKVFLSSHHFCWRQEDIRSFHLWLSAPAVLLPSQQPHLWFVKILICSYGSGFQQWFLYKSLFVYKTIICLFRQNTALHSFANGIWFGGIPATVFSLLSMISHMKYPRV